MEVRYIHEDVLKKDGVIKKIIKKGVFDGEDCVPLPGQKVIVEYEARLENGTVVDRSSKHANSGDKYFQLTVGRGEVI